MDDSSRHGSEDLSSQKEFIVAYSGVNTAKADVINIKFAVVSGI